MARVRLPDMLKLKNWDEVDLNLKEIGELQYQLDTIEGEMNAHIADVKLDADMKAKPIQVRIKELEEEIKAYTDENREDLGNKKSKEMGFGKLGFRKSTKISLPSAKGKLDEIIRKLKTHNMQDCVIQPPEKIDKENLKKYPADDIIKIGANLKVNDVFWYEVDREKLTDL